MNPTFTISNRIAAALTQIERARGFLEAATLSDEWIKQMSDRALLLEAHYTTHIEGTQLTLDQSEKLLRGENVPEADPNDKRELLNYREAFSIVSQALEIGHPISEGIIREIHKLLVEGVRGGSADPGNYRRVQNYVANAATGEILYTPPPAHDVSSMMAELVKWLNTETETPPILKSGIAQFQLVHIHPFLDGNGRTSRLLSTLCLYRAGYDFKRLFTISEYYDRDRPAFYRAIQSVRKQNMDLTDWLEYYCVGLETQMVKVKTKGEWVIKRDVLRHKHSLHDRHMKGLDYLLEQGNLTIQEYGRLCSGVTRRSLQRDLKDLLDKGLIAEFGQGVTDPNRYYELKEL